MRTDCPKCRSAMDVGFIKDESYGTTHVTEWVEGEPEKSVWTGTKTSGRQLMPVTTYRCTSCGYLESYARPAPKS